MQPNTQGWCYSYYGRWNVEEKIKLGVVYFMLDEYVKKIINKEKERFEEEMSIVMDKFNKGYKDIIKKQAEEIKMIRISIGDMNKFMGKIIDLNELKKPVIVNTVKSKCKAKLKAEIKENEGDGYL